LGNWEKTTDLVWNSYSTKILRLAFKEISYPIPSKLPVKGRSFSVQG